MIWDKKHGTSETMRSAIVNNCKRVMDAFGIDLIVPTGTAFENGWANGLTIKLDGSGHPWNAAAQYLAACTWYQTLFAPFLGKDIVDDIIPTEPQSWVGYNGTTMTLSVEECILAAKCAKAAVEDMWNVTTGIQ